MTSLNERFDQPCFKAYENLESLLLKSLSNESIAKKIEYVKCEGNLDVNQVVAELQTLKAICQNENFVCFEYVMRCAIWYHLNNLKT